MTFKKTFNAPVFLFFIFATLLFIYKLDYHYFFTDEIMYVQTGIEHFQGIYADALQIPPLPKYMAGLMYIISDSNIFLLRLPYALAGVATAYIIYLLIKREYNMFYGLVGATLFVSSKILFDATRLAMLEAFMHLFWVLFLYYYHDTFTTDKGTNKRYLQAGLFLGLSLATKLTSIVLLPFVVSGFFYMLLAKKSTKKELIKKYVYMVGSAIATALLTYMHFLHTTGIITAVVSTLREIKDIYITKSDEGKIHIIGDSVYEKSPWWTYVYYHIQHNGLARTLFYLILLPIALFKRNFFVTYWGAFFILILSFYQFSGVKNVRYIASFEIPLIILVVAGLVQLEKLLKDKTKYIIMGLLGAFLISQLTYLYTLQPTEYRGLFNYFKKETNNFMDYKRMFVFGSVRSMKYYRDQVPDMSMLLWRKDYEVMCPEFSTFEYFAFDKEELLKDPSNFMYTYVMANSDYFEPVEEIKDMHVFKKLESFESKIECPDILNP